MILCFRLYWFIESRVKGKMFAEIAGIEQIESVAGSTRRLRLKDPKNHALRQALENEDAAFKSTRSLSSQDSGILSKSLVTGHPTLLETPTFRYPSTRLLSFVGSNVSARSPD